MNLASTCFIFTYKCNWCSSFSNVEVSNIQVVKKLQIFRYYKYSNIEMFKYSNTLNLFSCSQPVRISQVCNFCFTTSLKKKSDLFLVNALKFWQPCELPGLKAGPCLSFKNLGNPLSFPSPVMGSQWAKACQDWLTTFRGQTEVEVRGCYLGGKSRKWNFFLGWKQSGR